LTDKEEDLEQLTLEKLKH